MGQDISSPIDESTPPETLTERSLDAVASLIRDGRARKVVVMVQCHSPFKALEFMS